MRDDILLLVLNSLLAILIKLLGLLIEWLADRWIDGFIFYLIVMGLKLLRRRWIRLLLLYFLL